MSLSVRALAATDTMPFIKAQWKFYKNDPNFVPPLLMDRQKLLNMRKNPFYKHSDMQLFLAERDGNVVGRIAAIVNDNHNQTHHDTLGFFGFFECEDRQETADALFAAASEWLRKKGKTDMRGPVNPSMNDETGLFVDGDDGPPVILMTYNPPYYENLILRSGFGVVKNLHAYFLDAADWMSDKLARLANVITQRNHITFRSVDLKTKDGFRRDVATLKDIYNRAWEPNWGFVKMTDEEFDFLAADLKQVADPEYAIIMEIKGVPAGFVLALPDINQALIHNKNGGIIGGVWHLLTKRKSINRLRIIVLGVLPEFQKTGADAALYYEIGRRAYPKGIRTAEASWILEDNVMMIRGLTQTMKARHYRTYRLYQKSL